MTILMLKSTLLVQGYIRSMCKGKNTSLFTFTMNNPIYIENNGKQTLVGENTLKRTLLPKRTFWLFS